MNEKLRHYIDDLFANAPSTVRAVELKEEMYQNLMDKYNDLINEGKSEESAYNIAVASIGDVDIATNADKITVSVQEGNGASHGVYSVSGTKITYTPSTNFNGTDQITYTVTDDAKKTASDKAATPCPQTPPH